MENHGDHDTRLKGPRAIQPAAQANDAKSPILPVLMRRPWHKGPMVWEVKHLRFHPVDADGLPGEPLHLVIARDVLNPAELKFFVSNAPAGTPVPRMLLVAFSRWRVERCFEDQKGEIGLDQYEGRRYRGLRRHLILSGISYLFLSRVRQEFGGEKPGADGVPGAHGGGGLDPVLVAGPEPAEGPAGADVGGDRAAQRRNALARRCHTRRTRRRLHALGIRLTKVPRCRWGPT